MRLEELAALFAVREVTFYSLQIVVPERDAAYFKSQTGLVNLSGQMKDFLETSAVVAELDLVITVDTAVAHLAGALGKPVWMLLPFAPDWRWLRERTDSPWYPTMRLFRQAQRNQWAPVVGQVAEELGRMAVLGTVKDAQV
jgi:ADP-heptose:LPS heptosyltransferase